MRLVTRYSYRGYPYTLWEKEVPRIQDEYLDCSIYLYASVTDAERGNNIGGSGFLCSVPALHVKDGMFIYAVTNRHIIDDGYSTVRINTQDGKTDIFEFEERNWIRHPQGDDLAIHPMPALNSDIYKYKSVGSDLFLDNKTVERYNIGIGDDVFVVGRFINHEGKQQNNPSLRFGHIAQMNNNPILIKRGFSYFEQECFLVEARSIGGYSGSPVFLELSSFYSRPERTEPSPNRRWLLGVDCAYLNNRLPVRDKNGDPIQQEYHVESNTGMMPVIPAWKLTEMIDSNLLIESRKKQEEFYMKNNPLPVVTLTSSKEEKAINTSDNSSHKEDFIWLVDAASKKQPQDN